MRVHLSYSSNRLLFVYHHFQDINEDPQLDETEEVEEEVGGTVPKIGSQGPGDEIAALVIWVFPHFKHCLLLQILLSAVPEPIYW